MLLAVSGCTSGGDRPSEDVVAVTVPSAATAAPGVLPAPEALAEVMYRLADPAVPGPAKLPLVDGATAADAAKLDSFATALRDGGFLPVTFTVADVRPSDESGDVTATVTVGTGGPAGTGNRGDTGDRGDRVDRGDRGTFSFPMEFHAGPDGWQLSDETAEMLLAVGNSSGSGTGS